MILLVHIAFSLLSIGMATLNLILPSQVRLYMTYGLTGMSLLSGFILALQTPSDISQTCVKGGVYVAFVVASSLLTRHRLALAK